MRLITTCPQCETSFRVVADQLKLHRGMVRCGKCQAVFSGIERLRQLPEQSAAAKPLPGLPSVAPSSAAAPGEAIRGAAESRAVHPPVPEAREVGPRAAESRAAEPAPDSRAGTPPTPQTPGLPAAFFGLDTPPPPIGRPETRAAPGALPMPEPERETTGVRERASEREATSERKAPSERATPLEPAPETTPADPELASVFRQPPGRQAAKVRRASTTVPAVDRAAEVAPPVLTTEPDADDLRLARELEAAAREIEAGADDEQAIDFFSTDRKRRGLLRRLGPVRLAGAALLSLLLVLQASLANRHYLVARFPAMEPAIAMLASPLGLPIELPKALDALAIESFELQQTATPGLFSVAAIVRNDAGYAVRWPSMLLTLTDPANRVLVRKAIDPADFLDDSAVASGLRARSERPIRMALEVADLQPAGYSVVLLYR